MSSPKLSVGLPVYNGERYLRQTLDSLLGQEFRDLELIISDNGSSDGTAAICEAYAKADKRVRYYRSNTNQGATWNYRRVLELAEGIYFKWAAYDDECLPAMLRRCVEAMDNADESVVLVYPWFEFIDESGSVIRHMFGINWDHIHTAAQAPYQRLSRVIFRNMHGPAIYGVIKTEVLRKTRPFGSIAADWVKLVELSMVGRIVEVPEVLFRLRIHQTNSIVVNKSWRQLLAWHDPNLGGKAPLIPYDCAIVREYLKTIHSLRMSALDKLMCYCAACTIPSYRWCYRKLLRYTGPARQRLHTMTGWGWLSRGSGAV